MLLGRQHRQQQEGRAVQIALRPGKVATLVRFVPSRPGRPRRPGPPSPQKPVAVVSLVLLLLFSPTAGKPLRRILLPTTVALAKDPIVTPQFFLGLLVQELRDPL